MSSPENVFKGDRAGLHTVDVDAPLAESKSPCCDYYPTAYKNAVKVEEGRGDTHKASVCRFLQILTGFATKFDTPEEPFVPFMQLGDGRRSLIPSDLSADDVEVVRELGKLSSDPELRARLHDIVWERTKDYTAGMEAAQCYIAAAERLNTAEDWVVIPGGSISPCFKL